MDVRDAADAGSITLNVNNISNERVPLLISSESKIFEQEQAHSDGLVDRAIVEDVATEPSISSAGVIHETTDTHSGAVPVNASTEFKFVDLQSQESLVDEAKAEKDKTVEENQTTIQRLLDERVSVL